MKKLFLFLIPCAISALLTVSCKSKNAQEQVEQTDSTVFQRTVISSAAAGDIVYVELDSLTANYLMTKDLMGELEQKMNKLQADLTNRQKKFQANVSDFQNKATKGLETRSKLEEMQQQLAIEEQNLMQLSEKYRMDMAEEQAVMQRKILQAIMDYLKEYNKEKGYKYILGNAFDAKILYADPSLDITTDVLQGINTKYKAEQKN
jgi:outer membrane protein